MASLNWTDQEKTRNRSVTRVRTDVTDDRPGRVFFLDRPHSDFMTSSFSSVGLE